MQLLPIRRQAILPPQAEEPTIDQMKVGEVCYTLPWGMWVDSNRLCWLHPKYPAENRPGGTVEMRVELRKDGFHVWVPKGRSWKPSSKPGFVSPADTKYLPVVELHMEFR